MEKQLDAISIKDMLKTLSSGIPSEITFVTYSRKTGEGGKKITVKKAVIASGVNSNSELRNPNHYANYTRLLRDIDSDQLIKFRPSLVTRFMGRPIML